MSNSFNQILDFSLFIKILPQVSELIVGWNHFSNKPSVNLKNKNKKKQLTLKMHVFYMYMYIYNKYVYL